MDFLDAANVINDRRHKINKWTSYIQKNGSYDDILKNIDHENIRSVFEIGTQNGGSAQVLSKMFPNAKIYTMDINPLNIDLGENIISLVNDATKISSLSPLPMFDIIWDDGSHSSTDQIKSFSYLFKEKLNNDGIYVVEDLEHCYQPWWKKTSNDINFHDYIRRLIDSIHARQSHTISTNRGELKIKPDYYSDNLFNISIYKQVVCFKKRYDQNENKSIIF
jgi:trans-aconitate methyltransferase